MNAEGTQVEKILRTLQERAKELNCLYRVDELLSRRDLGIEEICRGIIAILPSGWQYPAICEARIMIDNLGCAPDFDPGLAGVIHEKQKGSIVFGQIPD